jgi:hypothetical protein
MTTYAHLIATAYSFNQSLTACASLPPVLLRQSKRFLEFFISRTVSFMCYAIAVHAGSCSTTVTFPFISQDIRCSDKFRTSRVGAICWLYCRKFFLLSFVFLYQGLRQELVECLKFNSLFAAGYWKELIILQRSSNKIHCTISTISVATRRNSRQVLENELLSTDCTGIHTGCFICGIAACHGHLL